jgi:hypothetical protein
MDSVFNVKNFSILLKRAGMAKRVRSSLRYSRCKWQASSHIW